MKKPVQIVIKFIGLVFFLPLWVFIAVTRRLSKKNTVKKKPRLVWGPIPVISNKYWSDALKSGGYDSETLMENYFSIIHKKEHFDKYTYELTTLLSEINHPVFKKFYLYFLPYIGFTYALCRYDIFHHHFLGGFLGGSIFWKLEAYLLKLAGCKTVITAFGGDFYQYSKIVDMSWRHVLLMNFPRYAPTEPVIARRVKYWTRHADIIINGFQIDGLGRWDVLPYNMVTIDCDLWKSKKIYSKNNGTNGFVKIMHTPNHRGIKGTEFLLEAIKELQSEGLQIELILLEKLQNEIVKEKMQEADILVEQLILGYGLTAIEGMASGLPVLTNLENENYTLLFRRYSYLNECPILSSSPENIKHNLRLLITNPLLREELGIASRQYAEKYHSKETAQYMFGKIYEKIWFDKEVDLLNLFHPVKSEFNKRTPFIKHPLVENKFASNQYS